MRLLILTQKVDQNDDILGFFHGWIREFSKNFETITVISLGVGEYNLPANVRVLSLYIWTKSMFYSVLLCGRSLVRKSQCGETIMQGVCLRASQWWCRINYFVLQSIHLLHIQRKQHWCQWGLIQAFLRNKGIFKSKITQFCFLHESHPQKNQI